MEGDGAKDFTVIVEVKSLGRLTLCDPMDCSLPGFSVHGIFQARVLEWVAISFSRRSAWPRDQTQVSCTAGRHFTLWATREAPYNYNHQAKNIMITHRSTPTPAKNCRCYCWNYALLFCLCILKDNLPLLGYIYLRVSCVAGGFFTNWALRKALFSMQSVLFALSSYFRPDTSDNILSTSIPVYSLSPLFSSQSRNP